MTRDEIAALCPQVEKLAQALVARRTLSAADFAAEVKVLLASQ